MSNPITVFIFDKPVSSVIPPEVENAFAAFFGEMEEVEVRHERHNSGPIGRRGRHDVNEEATARIASIERMMQSLLVTAIRQQTDTVLARMKKRSDTADFNDSGSIIAFSHFTKKNQGCAWIKQEEVAEFVNIELTISQREGSGFVGDSVLIAEMTDFDTAYRFIAEHQAEIIQQFEIMIARANEQGEA